MPLLPDKKNIGNNIREMQNSGHPYRQALAAALSKAYDNKSKNSVDHSNMKQSTKKR
jgi:hypothetical protein